MRRMPWILYLWPGLPQIWLFGSWSGLAAAVGAAGLLDLLLLVSFGWTELIGQNVRMILWAIFVAAWIASIVWSQRQCRRQAIASSLQPEADTFGQAVDHYLKGDYYQTEQVLEGLLRRNARDLDARLMLATVLRRGQRFEEAKGQLDTLVRFEGAEKWNVEIEDERDLLAEAKTQKASAA
jgi:hypothetical protein